MQIHDYIEWIAIILLGIMTFIQHKYLSFLMDALISTNRVLLDVVEEVNNIIDDVYDNEGGDLDGEHEQRP